MLVYWFIGVIVGLIIFASTASPWLGLFSIVGFVYTIFRDSN